MAAPRLSVKDSGSWKTVEAPYVKENDSWKFIHNIWVKNGGSWKLAHKSAIGRYTAEAEISGQTDTTTNATISGSYTVEQGTRYLRVQLTAGGGQGGGGARTGGSGLAGGHWLCPNVTNSPPTLETATDYATGGQGGHPGLVDVTFEVIPGETYTWTGGTGGWTSAQQSDNSLELSWYSGTGTQNAVGSALSGATGEAGDNIVFSGTSGSITAGGGLGGVGGTVTVSANCTALGRYGYSVTTTNPSQSSRNSNSISMGTNLIHTTTNGTATSGGGAGGSYSAGGNIPRGTNGLISIWKYEA